MTSSALSSMRQRIAVADTAVVVVGGTGFVGSAVLTALERRGVSAVAVRAPRFDVTAGVERPDAVSVAAEHLRRQVTGAVAVVNAAGISDAASTAAAALDSANALVPKAIAMACAAEGIRLVHISSAAVQGRRSALDDSPDTTPLTPYARSKAAGERLVRQFASSAVVYRPPGVHGVARPVTRSLIRLAAGPASSVASPGDGNAPQALIQDVADAVAFLALCETPPPPIVHHPSSGLTTASLLRLLGGGRRPRQVPRRAARAVVGLSLAAGRLYAPLAAQARRLEVLWFGQGQSPSWLTAQGWQPPSDATGLAKPGAGSNCPLPNAHSHQTGRLMTTETPTASPFSGANVTITGGTGSFGSTMARHLLSRDVQRINILSRDEAKQDEMRQRLGDPRVKFFVGDVRDYDSVADAVTGADFVFHAAALKQVPSCEFFPDQAVKTNVIGSKNVIDASHRNGVRSVVCLSTDKAVYPVNAMGMSKALMEKTATGVRAQPAGLADDGLGHPLRQRHVLARLGHPALRPAARAGASRSPSPSRR